MKRTPNSKKAAQGKTNRSETKRNPSILPHHQARQNQAGQKETPRSHQKVTDSEKFRKIKRKKNRQRMIFATLCVLIIMMISGVLVFKILTAREEQLEFMFIQHGKVQSKARGEGIIIRDEKSYPSPSDGLLKGVAGEEEKVSKGQLVVKIIPEDKEAEFQKLKEIETQILDRQITLIEHGKAPEASHVYYEAEEATQSLLHNLRRELIKEITPDLSAYKIAFQVMVANRNEKLRGIQFSDDILKDLQQNYKQLEDQIGGAVAEIRSEQAGIVSYHIDGMEHINSEFLQDATIDTYHNYLKDISQVKKIGLNVQAGDAVFRLTDSVYQYFIMVFPELDGDIIDQEKSYSLTITTDGSEIDNCKILQLQKTATGCFVVFQTDQKIEKFLKQRQIDAELTLESREGHMVPLTALQNINVETRRADIMMVTNGTVQKKEIEIIAADRENAIIKSLETTESGQEKEPKEGTMIVLNPEKAEEGQKIT